ncbi:sulfatase-like hydrolase/transferase [Mesorhizobium sp. NZP2077]|uniref:sulfatase-like hydrolase/transferase n=1 Tax=Mesorhizobium sp. NZP2077 TaxID=2483404 RepID=UPI001554D32A|nr:sulfatase-like hydrolase/transferase [Mesorhizobium sp. NZP2077]QKD17355.1 sulfatase-like hydrolase/transferase [Mesorhizobium sp. NZP2077]
MAAPTLVAWLEGKHTSWPLGFATFFLLFGLTHLLFPGNIVALWAAVMLTAIIGIVSKLKHRYLGFNFLAGDIYHLATSSFRGVLADHARMTIPALAAMITIVLGIIVLAQMLAEPAIPLPQRLSVFSAAAIVYLCVFWASGGPKRFRFRHLTDGRFHLSAFVASWLGAGPSRRPAFVDIDPEPLPLLPPVPASRPAHERPPHIIMILHESTFDPRRLGIAIDDASKRFFTLPDALSGALHVDVFGGSTLQTEFSVLTGLSSLSFGNDSRYVYHLLSGRVRHTLPSTLSGIGYNVSHISCDRPSFVNCGRFYQSIGFDEVGYAETLPPPFDAERWRRENHDEQLYDHALDQLSSRVAAGRPCFLSIATLMNHGDHRRRIFPIERHAELRRETIAATGIPSYGEYAVRLAESVAAYVAFRRRLEILLNGQPAIIVRYGDHQPSFTTALTGLRPSDPALRQTFYGIEAVNCRLPDDVAAPPVLDCAFLSTLTLLAARLPLDPVFATRAALLNDCAAPYFDSTSPRKRRFHRALVEAGMVDLA